MSKWVFDDEEKAKLQEAMERYKCVSEIRPDLHPAGAWDEIVGLAYEARSALWAECQPCWPDLARLIYLITKLDEQKFKIT